MIQNDNLNKNGYRKARYVKYGHDTGTTDAQNADSTNFVLDKKKFVFITEPLRIIWTCRIITTWSHKQLSRGKPVLKVTSKLPR